MKAQLLLHLLFQAVLLFDTSAWEVKMPKDIRGLQGSCLVIPCSFSYSSYPPENPRRVVWYQWVSKGYPLVYDPLHADDVIEMFRGKTFLYGNPSNGDCSLLITNLEKSHNEEKLYAWIDPENIGWRTYAFYDVTSTILVDASPQQPSISIYGGERMGETITMTCSTFHTCPYSKPSIILKGPEGTDKLVNEHIKDGLWNITLTRTGVIETEISTIECSVTHHGGITVTATKDKSAKCVHQKITIEPELADFTEGVAKNFICSVYHSCQKETPTITWNYKNMRVSTWSKTLSSLDRVTYSNITFLGSKDDHEKKLICTVKFSGKDITASVVLHVQYPLLIGMKTIGLYILAPSLVFLLTCIIAGVIIYKKRQRSKNACTVLGNAPFSKPHMPSPKSDPKSYYSNDYEAEYAEMDELNMYENI
ncbi:sialoadhesin-like [Ctenopharyngodon idella]|uniref:sialoadhesin-like n=1 Tax=Ctenopharyngodon idella TaxID=7959 RepID=UPI0022308BE5|nr:sialoadhesin-like [Ctenopharyngodon idella]XP_051720144.1 sialoadhesin-like [Ctenopharyngodon idella]